MLRRSSIFLAVSIVIVMAFIFLTPVVVRWQLESQLSELLEQPVTVDAVQLKVFGGQATVTGLRIGENTRLGRVHVTVALSPLMDNEVRVAGIEISDLIVPVIVDGDDIVVAGYRIPPAAKDDGTGGPGWHVLVAAASIKDADLSILLNGASHRLQVEDIDVDDFDSALESPFDVELEVTVNGSRLQGAATVDLSGGNQSVRGNVKVADLNLVDFQDLIPEPVLAGINLSGDFDVQITPASISFSAAGLDAEVTGLSVPSVPAEVEKVSWKGAITAEVADADIRVSVDGDLDVARLNHPEIVASAMNYGGTAEVALSDGVLNTLAAAGDFSAGPLSAQGVTIGSISLANIEASEQRVRVEESSVTDADYPALGTIGSVTVANLDGSRERISATRVNVVDAKIRITRGADGRIEGMTASEVESPTQVEGETDAAEQTSGPIQLDIAKLTVAGESEFMFRDDSVSPATEFLFNNVALDVENIRTGEPLRYTISAYHPEHTDEAGLISEGTLSALGDALNGDLKVSLNRFDLHEIDPYVGGGIRSGRLKLDSTVAIRNGVVDASNDVEIVGVKVDSTGQESGGSEMPLSLALSLLKDKNDRISLNVPIQSSLDELNVDTGDIVNKAMGNAAKKAAMTYATLALQPYGALMMLKGVADRAAQPKFEPIVFAAGEATMSSDSRTYVSKLATLLEDRPALTITVCGYATLLDPSPEAVGEPDGTALEEAQVAPTAEAGPVPSRRELAEMRGSTVRGAIAEAGVSSSRIFSCSPGVISDNSSPRVEISL